MSSSSDLLTSTEAAMLLGVSPSSIKRWAEEGLVPCIKTAGNHRRFERGVLERFRNSGAAPAAAVPAVMSLDWIDEILGAADPQALAARLLDERARLGSWWRVADRLGSVLAAIGQRWLEGELTILEEHLASERLSRALARVCEWIPLPQTAPRALLATAQGDDHTLGLSLVEVCLRELGWNTLWAGRNLPTQELADQIATMLPSIELLAVSASAASADASTLDAQARRLGEACRAAGVALLLGGSGSWSDPAYGKRVRSIEALHDHARALLGPRA